MCVCVCVCVLIYFQSITQILKINFKKPKKTSKQNLM